jgi:hypothetical protein
MNKPEFIYQKYLENEKLKKVLALDLTKKDKKYLNREANLDPKMGLKIATAFYLLNSYPKNEQGVGVIPKNFFTDNQFHGEPFGDYLKKALMVPGFIKKDEKGNMVFDSQNKKFDDELGWDIYRYGLLFDRVRKTFSKHNKKTKKNNQQKIDFNETLVTEVTASNNPTPVPVNVIEDNHAITTKQTNEDQPTHERIKDLYFGEFDKEVRSGKYYSEDNVKKWDAKIKNTPVRMGHVLYSDKLKTLTGLIKNKTLTEYGDRYRVDRNQRPAYKACGFVVKVSTNPEMFKINIDDVTTTVDSVVAYQAFKSRVGVIKAGGPTNNESDKQKREIVVRPENSETQEKESKPAQSNIKCNSDLDRSVFELNNKFDVMDSKLNKLIEMISNQKGGKSDDIFTDLLKEALKNYLSKK